MRDLDGRWKRKSATDEPKPLGTDESLIDWMLAQDNISDDVEALYPGIRAVQIRLGEHKSTALPGGIKGRPRVQAIHDSLRRPLHTAV